MYFTHWSSDGPYRWPKNEMIINKIAQNWKMCVTFYETKSGLFGAGPISDGLVGPSQKKM